MAEVLAEGGFGWSVPGWLLAVIGLSGFTGEPVPLQMRGFEEFPEFAQRMWGAPEMAAIMANPSCDGPVAYVDRSLVEADIANV